MTENSPPSPDELDLIRHATFLERKAARHFERGNLWQALAVQRQSMRIWMVCSRFDREAQCAQTIGDLCFRLNDHHAAIASYKRARELRVQLNDMHGLAISIGRAAAVHQHLGNHQKALELLEVTLSHWRAQSHRKELGIVLNNIGVSYGALGQRATARFHYEQALTIRWDINDREGIAATLHNLGALCLDEQNLHDARRFLNEAALIHRDLNAKADLGRTLLYLGFLHAKEQNLPQAVRYYEKAYQLATAPDVNDPNVEAAALHQLGAAALAAGEPARALRLLEQAHSIFVTTGMSQGVAKLHYLCGCAHQKMGHAGKAMQCLSQAGTMQEKINDRSGLAATFVAMAMLLSESGRQAPAYDMLIKASRLQKELSEDQAYMNTINVLVHVCELQGKDEEAIRYKRLGTAVRARQSPIESTATNHVHGECK